MPGQRVEPHQLTEGDRALLHWSPYEWARQSDGYRTPIEVTVRHVTGFDVAPEIDSVMGREPDVGLVWNGLKMTHNTKRGYITGQNSHPDTPGSTDIGRFRRYEALPGEMYGLLDDADGGGPADPFDFSG